MTPMTHSHGATWWGQEVATRWFPTLSEGGENSAPRPPVRLRRHGGGRARPRVAWGARARSTLLAALIIIIFPPNELAFWGLYHIQKLMKLGGRISRGENLRVLWFAAVYRPKWRGPGP